MVYVDLTQCDCLACRVKLDSDVFAKSRIYGISQILDTALVVHEIFDSPGAHPISSKKERNQEASLIARLAAINSARTVDVATELCFLLDQDTAPPNT